jgi:hypothetical protein
MLGRHELIEAEFVEMAPLNHRPNRSLPPTVPENLYWALADYDRSFARSTAWLVSSGFFFYWCYSKIIAPLMPQAGTLDAAKYAHAARLAMCYLRCSDFGS